MSNENVYLPGKIRDRIQDLMKSHKVTQAELATRIGCSESMVQFQIISICRGREIGFRSITK